MKTPNLWQKLVAGFKKLFQRLKKKDEHVNKKTDETFFRDSGESVYHKKKGERKKRKIRKRMENKTRSVNAKINKTWKK